MQGLGPIDLAIRKVVIEALRASNSQAEASLKLHVSRWTLSRYIKRYEITEEDYGRLSGRAVVDEGE